VKSLKKLIPYYLHGFLLAFIAPISVYVTYQDASLFNKPDSVWRLTVFCLAYFILNALLFFFIFKDHSTAGMMTTFSILGMLFLWRNFVIFIIAILLGWACLALLIKRRRALHLNNIMLATSFSVVAYFGFNYVKMLYNMNWDDKTPMTQPVLSDFVVPSGITKPDIYYIILDGYGSAEMIQNVHGFDNSAFIEELKKRGFIVPSKSSANYPRTLLALSSTLNMQYLDSVSEKMGDSYIWWPLKGTFEHNAVRTFLENQGYHTVAVMSSWDFTSVTDADIYLHPYPVTLNKFEEVYLQNTNINVFGPLVKDWVALPSYDTHRKIVESSFEYMKQIPGFASPKFSYLHIVSPHTPFVFDAQGNEIDPDYLYTLSDDFIASPSAYRQGYVDQINFLNRKVLDAIDTILASSKTPPIIIIQGDHGSGSFADYNSLGNTCIYERYSILNAYYLPGMDPALIPDDITPVNTFRVLFNHYFSTGMEILPNRNYFSRAIRMYQFEDVSDKVGVPCGKIPEDIP
jgi:hypothetical protein